MNDDQWKYMLSVKFGPSGALLNVRGANWEDFAQNLSNLAEGFPLVKDSAALFDVAVPAPVPIADARAVPPATPAAAPAPNAGEIGPIAVEKLEFKEGVGQRGKWRMGKVIFGGGIAASTFDALLLSVAEANVGKRVFVAIKPNEKYPKSNDLVSIRPAA